MHFAEVRGREKKPEGQKYIGETRCDKEFANKQKRHLAGRKRCGVQGVHLNPLDICLRTSVPCVRSILSACRPS